MTGCDCSSNEHHARDGHRNHFVKGGNFSFIREQTDRMNRIGRLETISQDPVSDSRNASGRMLMNAEHGSREPRLGNDPPARVSVGPPGNTDPVLV